jgi:(2Fe-2S) ferredoxin
METMGYGKTTQDSDFALEGRLLGFVLEDGFKIKGLRLSTANGECYIKLSKEARAAFKGILRPGDWLQVIGKQKLDGETGLPKLKAYQVLPAVPGSLTSSPVAIVEPSAKPQNRQASILVCRKSDCLKRGSQGICNALMAALAAQGLDKQVNIKPTGCMKDCKSGPNLVFLPDKARYHNVKLQEIPSLVAKHLG